MEFCYDDIDADVLIIVADGGLNRDTADQFVSEIETLVDAGLRKIIVDCSNLEFISSYGIGVLVRLHKRMKKHDGDVKIASVKGLIVQVLQIAHLTKLLDIYPEVDQARLAFRPKTAR